MPAKRSFILSTAPPWAAICAAAAISHPSEAQFVGQGAEKAPTKVSDILLKPVHDQQVVLRGRIVKELNDEHFTFTDGTAEIRAEIDDELLQGQQISGSTIVEIHGEVELDFNSEPEIDVERLTIITP